MIISDTTKERLRELFHYSLDTGVFTRRIKASNSPAGSVAGGLNGEGYRLIRVDGKKYKAHRLAFIYVNGEAPKNVDHVNGIKSDNRWANLRSATRSQNGANRKVQKNNTSGCKNVYWSKDHQKWRVILKVNYKPVHCGIYEDRELAELVAEMAREKYFQQYGTNYEGDGFA